MLLPMSLDTLRSPRVRRVAAVATIIVFVAGAAAAGIGRGCRSARAGEARDLSQVPGPWENHTVSLPDRVSARDGSTQPLAMHYLAAGPADAPVVVLLHGFPDLSWSWREVIPLLATDHRVIAPDLRGYGGTDRPRDGYDVHTLAADVAALLDHLAGDNPVHLVGHDWGAAVSWWVAISHPDRLLSHTALSVPHPAVMADFLRNDPQQRRRSNYMLVLAAPGTAGVMARSSPALREQLYRANLLNPDGFDDEDLAWYTAAFDTAEEMRGPLMYYRAAMRDRRGQRAALEEAAPVSVPTLMLTGREDRYLGWEMAAPSCDHVAAACEAQVIDDAGHFLHWEDPDEVVRRWRTFSAGNVDTP